MINGQETGADIISEMRRAKTEFPFVYLMGEPDTPEVIDAKTKEIVAPRKINIRRVTVSELADRFEAAYKRERGDAAAMRKALIRCATLGEYCFQDIHAEVANVSRAALAEPPRNCDIIPDEKLVDEFCRYLGYDPMNPNNGYADGQDRFMREHWFEFSKWIVMPYNQEGGAK